MSEQQNEKEEKEYLYHFLTGDKELYCLTEEKTRELMELIRDGEGIRHH